MNAHPFHDRRAIRAYNEAQRDAIYATEREANQREPKAPEPCNFCAPEDYAPDRFAELRADLGPYWLVWLVAFVGTCIVSAWLAARLVADLVAQP